MKQYYIWIILGIVAFLLIGIIIYFSFFVHGTSGQNKTANFNLGVSQTNSTSSSSQVGVVTTSSPDAIMIPTANSTIATKNFIRNGVTVQDPANKNSYYIAGSSGACTSSGNCPKAGSNTDYNIVYNKLDGTFILGLATEPLGTARLEAEKALQTQLGITQQQMCTLKYLVITTTYVNPQYGGKNLGFSFCPGSVQLPS